MKTRNGFVSNSSSSSFCCFGVALNELPEKLEEADDPYEVVEKANLCLYSEAEDINSGETIAQYIVGRSPDAMLDTETLGEFKNKISDDINALFKQYGARAKKFEVKLYSGQYGC